VEPPKKTHLTPKPSTEGPQNFEGRTAWKPRPFVSLLLRFSLSVTPIVVATIVTTAVGKIAFRSSWPLPGKVAWFAFIFLLATVSTVRTKRAIEKFLPLSLLVRSNLAFPEIAPSRMKLALRIGNTANRSEVATDFREHGLSSDPQVAAEQVLVLVEELNRHDRRTRGHSEKVRALSDVIGEQLGLSDQDREMLRWGSMLHDIGKLAVPAEILNKDTKLTDDEWNTLKNHPSEGQWRLEGLRPWLGDWVRCAWEHHERFDGTGYPNAIASSKLPIGSRIVAVADAFEVMTSVRSYKRAMSYNEARAELARCSGTHFDPEVVRAFLKVGEKSNGYGSGFVSALMHWFDTAQSLSVGNLSAAASAVVSGATALVLGASATVAPAPVAAPNPRKAPPAIELALLEAPQPTTTLSAPPPATTPLPAYTTTTTSIPTTTIIAALVEPQVSVVPTTAALVEASVVETVPPTEPPTTVLIIEPSPLPTTVEPTSTTRSTSSTSTTSTELPTTTTISEPIGIYLAPTVPSTTRASAPPVAAAEPISLTKHRTLPTIAP
jgi:HD domain